MRDSWSSYPKVWNLGHAAVEELFNDEVIVEEKIDGSQFSFGVFNGNLRCRSRGQEIILDAPEEMFIEAAEKAKELEKHLVDGWTYRAEYLKKPKQNTLVYDRIPNGHLIIFDINDGYESYLDYSQKEEESTRLGLESVPILHVGTISDSKGLLSLMETTSILGGQKIEGFVVKNYSRFGPDGKALFGKHVSEEFKEIHKKSWKDRHPGGKDIIEELAERYKTEARWNKAVLHLRERGELDGSPKDIGPLMKEVHQDVLEECRDEIGEILFKWAWRRLGRKLTGGLPDWYKDRLVKEQFGEIK